MTFTSRYRFARVATAVVAATATSLSLVPVAQGSSLLTTNARTCVKADNVWVYVEYDDDSNKQPEGGCATEFSNGIEALESAGFDIVAPGGFVSSINEVAPDWNATKTYWSYWAGTVVDGNKVDYEYYSVGAASSKPEPGSVEAWVVTDGSAKPSFTELPELDFGSSEGQDFTPIIAALVGILGLLGGVFAALQSGLLSIPGFVFPKF